MAVVINEFEVVAEPPTAPGAPAPAPAEAPAPMPTLPAQEVARILRYEAERLLRVSAH